MSLVFGLEIVKYSGEGPACESSASGEAFASFPGKERLIFFNKGNDTSLLGFRGIGSSVLPSVPIPHLMVTFLSSQGLTLAGGTFHFCVFSLSHNKTLGLIYNVFL